MLNSFKYRCTHCNEIITAHLTAVTVCVTCFTEINTPLLVESEAKKIVLNKIRESRLNNLINCLDTSLMNNDDIDGLDTLLGADHYWLINDKFLFKALQADESQVTATVCDLWIWGRCNTTGLALWKDDVILNFAIKRLGV